MEQQFTLRGEKLHKFNVDDYLKRSKGYKRIHMPQLDYEQLIGSMSDLSKYFPVYKCMLPVKLMKPTQSEINMDKVVNNLATYGKQNPNEVEFVLSKGNYLLDGHHRHVSLMLTDPEALVTCYVFVSLEIDDLISIIKRFDEILKPYKTIKESADEIEMSSKIYDILESLKADDVLSETTVNSIVRGSQLLQEAAVKHDEAIMDATVDEKQKFISGLIEAVNRIFGVNIISESIVNERLLTVDDLKRVADEYRRKHGLSDDDSIIDHMRQMEESYGMQAPNVVPGMGSVNFPTENGTGSGDMVFNWTFTTNDNNFANMLNIGKDEDTEEKIDEMLSQLKAQIMTKAGCIVFEENANLRLRTHFESADDITDWENCETLPTIRKCKQIDTEFSAKTLEGITQGKAGDYLMRGIDNEIYPVDAEVFQKTYKKH